MDKDWSRGCNYQSALQGLSSSGRRITDFCPLTLDINTTHSELCLSEGTKKMTLKRTVTEYPDHLDRIDCWPQVLCREALTGACCYWEVEGTGGLMKTGVAYKGFV
ncbi:stonustoxin subunit beta-like [Erpetoichthys calabaricus]|uniref:stonustoxin subunit beta-like n=1 Tax=Erpetoichthys calabaricus TaxID=27687 RepID=UPI002233F6AC|nr:stonustoxin subunit beta-like [Erpetoichthys calabaricus]